MKTYTFLNFPAHGHVNPTLPVVQELVSRGEEVTYYLQEEFQGAVEATGATLRAYQTSFGKMPPPAEFANNSAAGGGLAEFLLLMLEESRRILPQVLDRIQAESPDCIVYDTMCLWARIVVQKLGIPAITLRPSYAINEHVNMFNADIRGNRPILSSMFEQVNSAIADLCAMYSVPSFDWRDIFTHSGAFNIVFLPRAFQPAGKTFDKRFVFVGPSISARNDETDFPLSQLEGRPTLYISLGTVFNNHADFFRMCFTAFGELPRQVVLSRGKRVDKATLGAVPQNFLVASHTPQLEVLQRSDVFITHGGMNSVMESLYYGVPLIVIPQMIEQEMTAQRVTELGLGVALDRETVTAEALREAVTHVSSNPTFRERVRDMQQMVHEAGGYRKAADAIMDFSGWRDRKKST